MKSPEVYSIFVLLLCIIILSPAAAWPQLTLGQYEDEAPVRTWNLLWGTSAQSLSMGGTQFAFVQDCSCALTNPALLDRLPRISFALSLSTTRASLSKYSIINTGVISTEGNSSLGLYAADFAGVSLRFRRWTFAFCTALIENYDRPHVKLEYSYLGSPYESLDFNQGGELKNINISASHKIFRKVSLGIGVNFVSGFFEKNIEENWTQSNITITDSISHDFSGFYFNGGLVVDVSDSFTAAAVFRTPYSKKADSQSLLEYNAPQGDTDIKIEASSKCSFRQPLMVGVGINYKPSESIRIASDCAFFNWSEYKVNYFEEYLKRDFKNILKIGAGIEYITFHKFFNRNIEVPFRIGAAYDPQPMKNPNSRYFYFTFGMGAKYGKFFLNAAGMVGKEKGSGDNLLGQKFSITLGLYL